MARKFFGTDGIRGTANTDSMTAEVALKVGMAAGRVFRRGEHRHQVVIGKDTRRSGYMIEYAMTAGFNSVGMDVLLFGPIPTPAVAMLTRSMRADLGVMISASHNPYEDNGIKLFGPDGYKLSDEVELEIEKYLQAGLTEGLAAPALIGRSTRIEDAQARYIEFVKATIPRSLRLDGLKIVVDCAHGAAYKVAPTVLWELGAEVIRLGTEPNGYNINRQTGSTAPAAMCEAVRMHGADLGIALDGDADRVIIADENGAIIDGDQVMALIAKRWAVEGRLKGGGIVSTVMSNLGFERYLGSLGLKLHRTQVGDRYVVDAMRKLGMNVGGEQSGHIVLSDFSTTGDGLIAALQVLSVIVGEKKRASQAAHVFETVPQVLKNVRVNGAAPQALLESTSVKSAIAAAEAKLGASGRILVRKSGTEPVIRVMGEGDSETTVSSAVASIIGAIEAEAAR